MEGKMRKQGNKIPAVLAVSFFFSIFSSFLLAESRIPLPAGEPGANEVWFLDLDSILIKKGTFRLFSEDGKEIPFSLTREESS